nr:TetR/AcrR family transcriptional regulator [uncultured Roseateles sp.]
MDKSPTRKELSHERIVETAARAIRRAGFQGVGVADIMKEAGLTHGGFYAHFASRDALLCEALERAGQDGGAGLARRIVSQRLVDASALRQLVEAYLADGNLAATEHGCPVAALASEMPRQAPEVREVAAQRVRGLIATVAKALPAEADADSAAVIAAQLVGALQLARALGDNAQGRALLAATRRAVLVQHDTVSITPSH